MGSKSRPLHFTHSKNKKKTNKRSSKAKRKPSPPRSPKFRTVADVLRRAKRIRGTKAAKRLRVSPQQVLREIRDGVPSTELHEIRRRLELILSCTQVVGFALSEQNCQLDIDAARILGTHVTDALHVQIMKIDRLLGRDVDEDDIEEGEE